MRIFICGIALLLALSYAPMAVGQPKLPVAGKGISLEVVIVEVPGSAGTIAEAASMTQEKILELEKQGKIARWSRVQLTTLELQTAVMQFGERTSSSGPKPSGGLFQLGGSAASGQDSGIIVQITPRVEDNGSILMLFDVQQQILVEPPTAGGGEKKDAVPPPASKTALIRCSTTLRVVPGTWVVTGTQRADKAPTQTWIAVNAKVLEAK